MARELGGARPEQVAEIGEQLRPALRTRKRRSRSTRTIPAHGCRHGTGLTDMAIAHWCVDHAEPAGIGTIPLPAAGKLYLPLKVPVRTRACWSSSRTMPER
jgi:two-component system sensor histidine kinase KdpD